MTLAQSVSDYGALVTLGADLQHVFHSMRYLVVTASPNTYLMIGGGVLLFLWLLKRRP